LVKQVSRNENSSYSGPERKGLKKFGAILPVLGLLGALLSAPRTAQAGTGFFGTIGISIAVGTVLGASTLPFYSSPGDHWQNIAYGAGAGAAIGIGVAIFVGIFGPSHDEADNEVEPKAHFSDATVSRKFAYAEPNSSRTFDVPPSVSHPRIWMPLVSLSW
jgi:hypothetical protein